jgi:isoamylase
LIALRKRHHALRRRTFFDNPAGQTPGIIWHGTKPCEPDFSRSSHTIAFALDGRRTDRPEVDRDIYAAFNSYWEPLKFRIPASPSGRPWRRVVDTAMRSPEDALGLDEGPVVPVSKDYRLEARSMIILVSEA